MDLTAVLLKAVAARPRVLVTTLPGATPVRLAAERHLRSRDLPRALTPADADVLLVAGTHDPGLEAALERLWQDMPAPRFRAHAASAGDVAAAIETACLHLADPSEQRAHERGGRSLSGEDEGGHDAPDHASPEGRAGDHSGQGGGGMAMPAGLPMAAQGPDRDGLMLDQLHVALGPLLADWPEGLILRLTLQGDVIQRAELSLPAPRRPPSAVPFWTEPWARAAAGEQVHAAEAARRRAAGHLDSMGRFLAVAGWQAAATTARRLRDELLGGAGAAAVRPAAERFARQVGRSRTLSWLTRGLGRLSSADAVAAGIRGPAARADGDVPARYRLWLTAALEDLDRLEDRRLLDPAREEPPRGRLGGPHSPSAGLAGALPRLLEGAELGAARLIVASLDPDPDEWVAQPVESAHG
ncbi:hypothetical protein GBF35_26690 [Nonomuraea phyllanthi]|uniref:hypothetical protein n=1 Tax=Nonomuraea phyllanthi TaxID=2219224 RepID=UPI0012939E59|nr:hypothetical protein [Nonomuraea phyllanthi]QFY09758.1 hypothetical protein GBF35_26690 [Nonomuraea phyllanthi]